MTAAASVDGAFRIVAQHDPGAGGARRVEAPLAAGCNSRGQAMSSVKSKRAEASIQDESTLL